MADCSCLLLGESSAHRRIVETIHRVARLDAEVLITGPTGVGKELYARLLHQLSTRSAKEFVPLNCGAIPSELFENELFGHATGAYTGAVVKGEGVVVAADQGTLFLDEVNALPLACQVKLLRFLQFREYRRLGETKIRRVDVRVVAASNKDLGQDVRAGQFREDLYFRLKVVPIDVPPLRERPQDIEVLLVAFVESFAKRFSLPPVQFEDASLQSLRTYLWPGNVRELESCICYLTCMQFDRPVRVSDLPFSTSPKPATIFPQEFFELPLREAKRALVTAFETEYLERALRASEGNLSGAARASGKDRRAFFELMRKHSVQRSSEFVAQYQEMASRDSLPDHAKLQPEIEKHKAPGRATSITRRTGT